MTDIGPFPDRRKFLKGAAAAAGTLALPAMAAGDGFSGTEEEWHSGDLAHVLPTVNHERMLLKVSFVKPLAAVPRLNVGKQQVLGHKNDTDGRFWQFDVSGLKPAATYTLQLVDHTGKALCGKWPLATFPAPEATPASLRILAYTCAGGHPEMRAPGNIEAFRAMPIRHALLERALSFKPDAVIANGDHIYWDQRTWLESGSPAIRKLASDFYAKVGALDRNLPVFGTKNEIALKAAVDPQIIALYGTRLRSTPVFFFNDDHDYFENDEAEENFITFPPDHFELELARAVQHLYYPEFLPDATRSLMIPGTGAADRPSGVSECFGSLRYGQLIEVLMYDCGRYLSLKDHKAGLVPPEAEQWLVQRTKAQDTRHLIHMPSTPILYTAGKWREWYPDVAVTDEIMAEPGDTVTVHWYGVKGTNVRLTTQKHKYMWQRGWYEQHQRLLAAMSADTRPAISMSGDLHATGWDRIVESGGLDFRANPINVVLNGPIGTGLAGWPSAARGVPPTVAMGVKVESGNKPTEKNGFTIIEVTPDKVVAKLFAWREPEPVSNIAELQPYDVLEIPRKG